MAIALGGGQDPPRIVQAIEVRYWESNDLNYLVKSINIIII